MKTYLIFFILTNEVYVTNKSNEFYAWTIILTGLTLFQGWDSLMTEWNYNMKRNLFAEITDQINIHVISNEAFKTLTMTNLNLHMYILNNIKLKKFIYKPYLSNPAWKSKLMKWYFF